MTRESGTIGRLLGHVARLTELVRDRLTVEMYASFTHMLRAATEETAESGSTLDGLAQRHGGHPALLDRGLRPRRRKHGARRQLAVSRHGPPRRARGADRRPSCRRARPARSRAGTLGLRLALEICNSAITYRSRYFTTLQAGPVLDLVIADDSNPRAVAFQLATLGRLLRSIGDGGDDRLTTQADALLHSAQAIVTDVTAAEEARNGAGGGARRSCAAWRKACVASPT